MDKEKMTKLNDGLKYAPSVYMAVANYRDLPLDDYTMGIINALPKEEILTDYLEWEGIIGYTNAIMSIVKA